MPKEFTSPICGCCADGCQRFCWHLCCTPCVVGKVAEAVGKNCCGYCLCFCLLHPCLRGDVQKAKGISEAGFISDLLLGWCCLLCTSYQEAKEVEVNPGCEVLSMAPTETTTPPATV